MFGTPLPPDGRTLTIVEGKQVRLWDVATGRRRAVLTGRDLTSPERNTYFPGQHPRSPCPTVSAAD